MTQKVIARKARRSTKRTRQHKRTISGGIPNPFGFISRKIGNQFARINYLKRFMAKFPPGNPIPDLTSNPFIKVNYIVVDPKLSNSSNSIYRDNVMPNIASALFKITDKIANILSNIQIVDLLGKTPNGKTVSQLYRLGYLGILFKNTDTGTSRLKNASGKQLSSLKCMTAKLQFPVDFVDNQPKLQNVKIFLYPILETDQRNVFTKLYPIGQPIKSLSTNDYNVKYLIYGDNQAIYITTSISGNIFYDLQSIETHFANTSMSSKKNKFIDTLSTEPNLKYLFDNGLLGILYTENGAIKCEYTYNKTRIEAELNADFLNPNSLEYGPTQNIKIFLYVTPVSQEATNVIASLQRGS